MNLFHTNSVTYSRISRFWLAACTAAVVFVLFVSLRPSAEQQTDAYMDTRRALNEHEPLVLVLQRASEALKSRICGQPAVDGYSTASAG